jgi:hypothetical protein
MSHSLDGTDFELKDDVWKYASTCCDPCGPPGDCWIRAEYLAWCMQGAEAPPLLVQGPPGGSVEDANVLFGGERVNADMRSGFRVRAGKWCDCCRTCGVELGFFMLDSGCDGTQASCPDNNTFIGRPYIDANTGQLEAQLICLPDVLSGVATVNACSNLLGVDALLRRNICCDPCSCYDPCDPCRTCIRRDFLFGFRYLHFGDELTVREALTPLSPLVVPGTRIDVVDSFRTRNDFYGVKFGLICERHRGRWSLEARPQVSAGVLDRRVSIRGNTLITIPGVPPTSLDGGLLALSSNMGDYHSSQFVVVPELDLQLGYLIRPHVRLLVGYSFLYLPQLARAAEQIDPVVNPDLIPPVTPPVPGPQRPAYQASTSDAWVQGLSVGAEWRF